jgi:hypothetical protein
MTKTSYFATTITLVVLAFSFSHCDPLYKAGNLVALGYPVETPLKSAVIRRYMDTLILKHGYNVPEKWKHFDKLVDLDSVYNKRIYFNANPEEMYLLSFGGMLQLMDVYNPLLVPNDWVSEKSKMPKLEEARILRRFKDEVLDVVDSLAKIDHLPDSLIYK